MTRAPRVISPQPLTASLGAPALSDGLTALGRNLIGEPADVLASHRKRRPALVNLGLLSP